MNFNYIKWIYAKSGKGAKHWVSSSPSSCSKRRQKSAPGQQPGHLYSSQIHEQVLRGIGMVMDVDAQYGDRWMTFMNCLSVLSLVPFQSRTGSHKYSMRAFEAVDCHIGDLQTSHTATQLSVMIGNHARLSWLPVRVHLASKVPPLDDVVLLWDWMKEVGWLADCFMQIVCLQSDGGSVWCRHAFWDVRLRQGVASFVHAAHLQTMSLIFCKDYGIGQKKVRLIFAGERNNPNGRRRRANVGTLSFKRSSHPAVRHNKEHAAA